MWGASHCESGGIRPTQRFKSCPRVGGLIKQDPRTTDQHEFQVGPPCGGHPATGLKSTWPAEFQVVPPCGGHQRKLSMAIIRILVSSRAPVWGASWWGGRCICRLARFKSCPRVGGILQIPFVQGGPRNVSSRAPVWGASRYQFRMKNTSLVSSRAPVWGASFQQFTSIWNL